MSAYPLRLYVYSLLVTRLPLWLLRFTFVYSASLSAFACVSSACAHSPFSRNKMNKWNLWISEFNNVVDRVIVITDNILLLRNSFYYILCVRCSMPGWRAGKNENTRYCAKFGPSNGNFGFLAHLNWTSQPDRSLWFCDELLNIQENESVGFDLFFPFYSQSNVGAHLLRSLSIAIRVWVCIVYATCVVRLRMCLLIVLWSFQMISSFFLLFASFGGYYVWMWVCVCRHCAR